MMHRAWFAVFTLAVTVTLLLSACQVPLKNY